MRQPFALNASVSPISLSFFLHFIDRKFKITARKIKLIATQNIDAYWISFSILLVLLLSGCFGDFGFFFCDYMYSHIKSESIMANTSKYCVFGCVRVCVVISRLYITLRDLCNLLVISKTQLFFSARNSTSVV